MFFKDVIGHEAIKQQLLRSAGSGIVPHAQLFCGQAGTGTFALAFAYARYLNCLDRTASDACGRCASCIKYNEIAHPDLHFAFPIVKDRKRELCADYMPEWREFLTAHRYFELNTWLDRLDAANKQATIYAKESDEIIRKLELRIYEAQYRILLVWMPERMHLTCANKLLKAIEEPPANTAILMVTESPEQVLGTIQSRSQRINIGPIDTDVLTQAVGNRFGLAADDARQIARMSHGNWLEAVGLVQVSEENAWYLEQFKRIMRNSWAKNVKEMKRFAEEMATIGRERQRHFLAYCQRLIRENFIYRFRTDEMNYMNRDEAAFAVRFAPFVNERNVIDFVDELHEAERHIAQNGNAKMVFFDLSLHITVLLKR